MRAFVMRSLLFIWITVATAPAYAAVIYVSPSGDDSTGQSWAEAYNTVQQAVDAASSGDEIWVEGGTYTAATATGSVVTLKSNISLYGGFDGTESVLGDRGDPFDNPTILSGDRDSSGTHNTDDSYRVVDYGYTTLSNILIDGFTVTGGYCPTTYCYGAGIRILGASNVTIRNTVVSNNRAYANAGMQLGGSDYTLQDVVFEANYAESGTGGGAYIGDPVDTLLERVTFIGNSATSGGGLYLNLGSGYASPTITLRQVRFIDNEARTSGSGGGMYSSRSSTLKDRPILEDVLFTGNSASTGGGMYLSQGALIYGATFIDNTATNTGGLFVHTGTSSANYQTIIVNSSFVDNASYGLTLSYGQPKVTNSSFVNNTLRILGSVPTINNSTFWGAGGPVVSSGTPTVNYSCVQNGWGGSGTGNVTPGSSPWVEAASGEVFLDQTGDCVDIGDDTTADSSTLGYPLFGMDWVDLTTDVDAALDVTDVDAARHYNPDHVWIATFTTAGGTLDWATNSADSCVLDDGSTVTSVNTNETGYGATSDTTYILTCKGENGPVSAEVYVP